MRGVRKSKAMKRLVTTEVRLRLRQLWRGENYTEEKTGPYRIQRKKILYTV